MMPKTAMIRRVTAGLAADNKMAGGIYSRLRSRFGWVGDSVIFLLLAGGVILILRGFGEAPVYTAVSVVDGDSLRDGPEQIRLHGIDAPEYRQQCSDENGKDYACGKFAARYLRKLVGQAPVTCSVIDTDRYDRTVGVCSVNDVELNKAMVEAGWAIAYIRHTPVYAVAEAKARKARRGIWKGRFEPPQEWRAAHRANLAVGQRTPD